MLRSEAAAAGAPGGVEAAAASSPRARLALEFAAAGQRALYAAQAAEAPEFAAA
jgi:hypothetical protein